MRSRQDQLQAYQYANQRVVAALVTHDPDPARSPVSRTGSTVLVGLLAALIGLGGTYAYHAISGRYGDEELRDDTVVFIEKETGAPYVYTKSDDHLHPVANFTSGLLISAADGAAPVTMRRSVLARLQRQAGLSLGDPLGIVDAPPAPPAPDTLIRTPWQLCTTGTSGPAPQTVLIVGGPAAADGRLLATPDPGGTGDALFVTDPAGTGYLLYANHKFLIRKRSAVLTAFAWAGQQPALVSDAWLNAVPTGTDLRPLRLTGLGGRSTVLDQRVGQLYQAPGPGATVQWKVVQRDGVLPITEVQGRLLDADPDTRIDKPIMISPAEFGALPPAGGDPGPAGQALLPATVPHLASMARSACVTIPDATQGATSIRVDPQVPVAPPRTRAATASSSVPTADRIAVPFGQGALVEAAASPDAPAGSSLPSLITDTGRRYPIADADALAKLGYGHTTAVRMPAEIVALLPVGPVLGTRQALSP